MLTIGVLVSGKPWFPIGVVEETVAGTVAHGEDTRELVMVEVLWEDGEEEETRGGELG